MSMKPKDFFPILRIFLETRIKKILGYKYIKIGKCRRCGGCCKDMQLFHRGKRITSVSDFEELLKFDGHFSRFTMFEKENGRISFTCSLLIENNLCGDYKSRPSTCRKYPDPEYIFKYGGVMIKGCGYTVIPVVSFQDILSREMGSDFEF